MCSKLYKPILNCPKVLKTVTITNKSTVLFFFGSFLCLALVKNEFEVDSCNFLSKSKKSIFRIFRAQKYGGEFG